jgi:hypothetical protein
LAHAISTGVWQYTARVYQLRLPRGATVEHVSSWMAQLAAVLRHSHWWDFWPRWPVGVELVATTHGIERLIVMPARLRKAVVATLAAALPGARLDHEIPTSAGRSCSRWIKAGEIRLRGVGQLLAVERGGDTSRHVLAALQPRKRGDLVRVQWLIVGARTPRPPRTTPATTPSPGVIIHDRRQVVAIRWQQADPVLSAVCRIGVFTQDRSQARVALRRVRAALRGQNTPGARLTPHGLLPSVLVAARLTRRSIPLLIWPLTLTSREIAGLLGLAIGDLPLPGVSVGLAPALPPSPTIPDTGVVMARANYPGINRLLCLDRDDRLRHLWIAGPTGVGKSTLLANLISYDIHRGDPVIVIDAGGDLITDVLARIPEARHNDVIVLDPTSQDRVIAHGRLR